MEHIIEKNLVVPGTEELWEILETVTDPEIPVLSVIDLGIIRNIQKINKDEKHPSGGWEITITPTYSGCPAMDMISMNIELALFEEGFHDIEIKTILSPAWTTGWITEKGKEKLAAYGIAPPLNKVSSCTSMEADEQMAIQCPHCKSYHTEMISRFGSTACKSLYKCLDCLEPFDYFKCH